MRILVIDDHQLFLDGLRHTLRQLDDAAEIVALSDVSQALEQLEAGGRFDLILLDLHMPGMDGRAMLQGLAERNLWIPVVVISAEANVQTIAEVLSQGALGFIPKTHSSDAMLEAVRSVLAGNVYLPDDLLSVIRRLEKRRNDKRQENPSAESDVETNFRENGITRRQYAVLELLGRGYSNKDIATTLNLTEHTIKSHISALFQILAVSNRTECMLEARRRELIPLAEETHRPLSEAGSSPF